MIVRNFILIVQKGCDQLVDILFIGWLWDFGSQHHQPSCFKLYGAYKLVGTIPLISSPWWEFQFLQNSLKIFVAPLFSHTCIFMTSWTAACQAYLSFTISQRLLKLMSIELVILSNHLVLCHSLLLLLFPSIRDFSDEKSALCIKCPK